MKYVIVYQAGIANVFEIDAEGNRKRLLQHAFAPCEWFMRGIQSGNPSADCFVAYCNQAGDIAHRTWDTRLDCAPFSDGMGLAWLPSFHEAHKTALAS